MTTDGMGCRTRGIVSASMFLIACTWSGDGIAQPATAPQPSVQTFTFNIPAKPLLAALADFTATTRIQVIRPSAEAVSGRSTAVSGSLSASEGLARLLAGTGLSYRFTSAGTVTIQRPSGESANFTAPGGAISLDTIEVQGAGDDTVGFVASRTSAGTKTDTPILEVPQSVSVVTRAELDVRNVQTDAEALTYTPGVFAQPFGGKQHQQNPFFYIRGFSSAFGGSYVDGLVSPVNYRYEPYGYERYDVFRGPTSTIYGQSDPGGLVNRVSKLPTSQPQREIQIQGGNYSNIQGAFDFSGPVDPQGQFLYRLTGLLRDANAPIDYDFGVKAPDKRTFMAPAVTWRPTTDTTITFLGNYLRDKVGQENSFFRKTSRNDPGFLTHISLAQPGLAEWDQEQYAVGYLLNHSFNKDLTFRQNVRYSHMNSTMLGVYQSNPENTGNTIDRYTSGNDEWRRDFAVDNQLQYKFSTGPVDHTTLLGFDYQNMTDWIAFTDGAAPSLNIRNPNYNQQFPSALPWYQHRYSGDSYGLYVQDQAKIGENWLLTLGGRQDWVSVKDIDELEHITTRSTDSRFTYRGGLTYLTSFGLAPYVSYTQSYLPQTGGNENGPFKPTTGEQYEAGIKYQPVGWNALFTAAIFDLRKQNVISYPRKPNEPSQQIGEIRSRGVELQATMSLTEGWNLTAGYTYNDVKVTNDLRPRFIGKRPVLTPEHMASGWLDYTFRQGRLSGLNLGGGVRYIGPSFGDNVNKLRNESYTLVDAALRYDLGQAVSSLKGAELAINATNLFGREYVVCFSVYDCKWGATRTVTGKLTYRW